METTLKSTKCSPLGDVPSTWGNYFHLNEKRKTKQPKGLLNIYCELILWKNVKKTECTVANLKRHYLLMEIKSWQNVDVFNWGEICLLAHPSPPRNCQESLAFSPFGPGWRTLFWTLGQDCDWIQTCWVDFLLCGVSKYRGTHQSLAECRHENSFLLEDWQAASIESFEFDERKRRKTGFAPNRHTISWVLSKIFLKDIFHCLLGARIPVLWREERTQW